MKKTKIGRTILDVIDEQEYLRRINTNPNAVSGLADDTAVVKGQYVYPITKQYSPNVVSVYDAGPVLLYSKPEEMIKSPDYDANNIIDFENVQGLRDSINRQAQLMQAERSILVSPDNIFTPNITDADTPEMKLLKEAIIRKSIDLEAYKSRFGSDYNNDRRIFEQNSITFFKMKRICDILDMKISMSLEDKPDAPNPIGEKLTTYITSDGE